MMDPAGGNGPGPGGGGPTTIDTIPIDLSTHTGNISTPHPLQLVDSESSDSGFQDALEVQSEVPTVVPTNITVVNVVPDDVLRVAECEGSLLGMLFRRSTMRRSMRPFVPSSGPSSRVASSQTETIAVPELVDNELRKVPPAPSTAMMINDNDTRRQSMRRRSVQFALDSSATSEVVNEPVADVTSGATVDTILVPIPEHETLGTLPLYSVATDALSEDNVGDQVTSTSTGVDSGRNSRSETEMEREVRVGGFWPHSSASILASLTCTVGMFDICRFSYLSFQYGGVFILQFLMLTVIFGIPMLSFQMAAGQYMGAGIMNMWKASPVFQGIGISAIFALSLIGVYNVVPVSWMFIYFRDSFVTTTTFRWGECRNIMRPEECLKSELNSTEIFKRAIPAYFQNRVLKSRSAGSAIGNGQPPDLIFENVFNLAVIWVIVFICLSRGSKSYAKVIVAFSVCPLVCFYLVAIEILRRGSTGTEQIMSLNTDMSAFFLNGWSWLAAAREVFFIWGINGAILMQIASHNRLKHNIKRDCIVIILVTLSVILLAAFFSCACIYIIYKTQKFSHRFIPSSYEMLEYSQFLIPTSQASKLTSDLDMYMSTNYLLGIESTTQKMDSTRASGYQVARLATEIFPMALVQLGPHRISAFWPVLFYLALIAFGIAQQLAIWRCVIEGFIAIRPKKLRQWETSITFFACIFGFVFGLPFTAEGGAFVIHFMDVCVGCIWWLLLVYLAQLFALVLIRGQPYTSDEIVSVLADTPFMKLWVAPVISFSWNVVLPIILMVLSIASFKLGDFGRMFSFEDGVGYIYWPSWAKQFGALIQVVPILIIPLVSLVQASRYLSPSEQTFATRLDNFLRPVLPFAPRGDGVNFGGMSSGALSGGGVVTLTTTDPVPDDPPPKYTPPPSYNTATGLKILKRLNSLRRSFRRSQRNFAASTSDVASMVTSSRVPAIRPSNTNGSNNDADVEMQQSTTASSISTDDAVSMTTTTSTVTSFDVPPSYATVVEAAGVANAGQ